MVTTLEILSQRLAREFPGEYSVMDLKAVVDCDGEPLPSISIYTASTSWIYGARTIDEAFEMMHAAKEGRPVPHKAPGDTVVHDDSTPLTEDTHATTDQTTATDQACGTCTGNDCHTGTDGTH